MTTFAAALAVERPDEIAALRGMSPEECIPKGLLEAYKETERERKNQRVADEVAS